uniref:Cilia- and flagella-associated protein 299 n=1 Tax=Rattus norvegicus TaxID=10116 RepID=A0A8I5ZT97_RAT
MRWEFQVICLLSWYLTTAEPQPRTDRKSGTDGVFIGRVRECLKQKPASKMSVFMTDCGTCQTGRTLTSAGKDLHDNFLKALAMREEDNRTGKLSTVIFIRDKNSHGQEVSGYIDYAHRLKSEDFEVYFNGKRRLLPRTTDMSFYNWDSHIAVCNSSPNYQVIADNPEGLLFKYKRDRKILNVDPKAHPGDNSTRIPIQTDLYTHAVLFDHVSRRKT